MNSITATDTCPADMAELIHASSRLGADPMLVQSAGGNTSIKEQQLMWIKASGTLLQEAQDKDIFVPVELERMRQSIASADALADKPQAFLAGTSHTLRPSIETSLHAIFKQRVVLHVHCIHTLAHAVRSDAQPILQQRLQGLNWVMVPYAKPGAELAKTVAEALTDDTNIVVLANHGLLVAADSVEQAEARVHDVHQRLAIAATAARPVDLKKLERLAVGSCYSLPQYLPVHQLALEPSRLQQAASGSLYPDHVIFCGVAATVLAANEDLLQLQQRFAAANLEAPVFVLVPGAGVLVRRDASSGAIALMRCLADVLARVPAQAKLNYLSDEQNAELLNWDAEKYRQALNV